MRIKLIRITTIPLSLKILLKGQHRFMSNYFKVIGVSSYGKELEDVKRDEEIEVVPIEMSRKITPLQDIKSLWYMYWFLKKEQPHIVHTHTPKAGIVGMLAARLAGVPYRLHTVAGLPLMEVKGTKRKILDLVEKITYSSATNVYPNSKGLYDFILQNNYTDKNKLKVIGKGSSNGIDTSYFSPNQITEAQKEFLRKELNIEVSDFVFIFVGRLVSDKGINELITAFKRINSEFSQSKLLLVGPLETELDPLKEETLKEMEQNKSILTVGYQNDVRPYFAIANALVFPSYREGFPNVVMQAGAMGLPCIVSDINGCNEIIIENNNGLIIPAKSTVRLEEAMRKILNDLNLRKQLQLNSRKRILENYEQKVVWEAILKEYRELEKKQ